MSNLYQTISMKFSIITLLFLFFGTGCDETTIAQQSSATPIPPTITTTSVPTTHPTTTKIPDPTFTVTSTPTSSPTATPTSTPTLTPTPQPQAQLHQLTSEGCCVQPFFSPDSQQVLFIDKPHAEAVTGVYGVDIANPQPEPILINEIIGFRTPDRTIVAVPNGDVFNFFNEATGEEWSVDTQANWPRFSADSQQILWNARDEIGPYDSRQVDVWVAKIDGREARSLFSILGGGAIAWFPDGKRILASGKNQPTDETRTLFVYDISTDLITNLFTETRLREIKLSPNGSWIVFYVTFADDPTNNGLWAIKTDGSTQYQLDVPRFGAYRWQDDNTLIYLPMRAEGETSMQLFAVDVPTNQITPLTDPQTLSFSVANGDWDVSPDGQRMVFVNSADFNLWVISLP